MNVNKVLNTGVHRYRRWLIDKKKHKKGQQSRMKYCFRQITFVWYVSRHFSHHFSYTLVS